MDRFRLFTLLVAVLLAVGEIARWWQSPRFLPLAFDELLVAAALAGAALKRPSGFRRSGGAALAAAWGAFCGLTLSLLVPTLDHLMHGPPKDGAGFYAGILAVMLAVGLWAVARAMRR